MPDEKKTEKIMSPAEAAQFLRSLAEHLEKGQMEFGDVLVDLDAPFKVKQSLKAKSDKISFKLKLKYDKAMATMGGPTGGDHPLLDSDDDDEDEPQDAGRRPSYKKLKKAMSGPFKQIKQSLAAGQSPPLELARSFCQQCLTMTEYPGKGEEHYASFQEQARLLLASVERGDLAQAQKSLAALDAQKQSCHDEHK
ncbi:MAG: GAK system XXXCH domain-containing protein [Pseudomonadota bacterium]